MNSLVREVKPNEVIVVERTINTDEPLELKLATVVRITLLWKSGRRARLRIESEDTDVVKHLTP